MQAGGEGGGDRHGTDRYNRVGWAVAARRVMLYRAKESTDSPSWVSQEEQEFGRETGEGRASPAGGMAQAETQVGKSGHIFTRQGVKGLALLIITILSNECLP